MLHVVAVASPQILLYLILAILSLALQLPVGCAGDNVKVFEGALGLKVSVLVKRLLCFELPV